MKTTRSVWTCPVSLLELISLECGTRDSSNPYTRFNLLNVNPYEHVKQEKNPAAPIN